MCYFGRDFDRQAGSRVQPARPTCACVFREGSGSNLVVEDNNKKTTTGKHMFHCRQFSAADGYAKSVSLAQNRAPHRWEAAVAAAFFCVFFPHAQCGETCPCLHALRRHLHIIMSCVIPHLDKKCFPSRCPPAGQKPRGMICWKTLV